MSEPKTSKSTQSSQPGTSPSSTTEEQLPTESDDEPDLDNWDDWFA